MFDVSRELDEIGKLIVSAALIMSVRKEVGKVMRDGFIVTDSKHQPGASGYEVVVRCGEDNRDEVARRIRGSVPDVKVEKIAEGVLGVRTARRGSRG